jgi:hypothetical protein
MTAIAFTSHFSRDKPFTGQKLDSGDPAQRAGHRKGSERGTKPKTVQVNITICFSAKMQS